MRWRLTLGPVLIALLIGAAWADEALTGLPAPSPLKTILPRLTTLPPGLLLLLIAVVLNCLAVRELVRIMRDNGIRASKRVASLAALSGLLVPAFVPGAMPGPSAVALLSTVAVAVLLVSLAYYSRRRTFEGIVAAAGGTMLMFVYPGLMFGFLLAIRRNHSAWMLLWIVLLTKACDSGAYFAGTALGRHKLIVWLSPGKTWEGLIGGLIAGAAAGIFGLWLLERYAPQPGMPPLWTGALAGVLFGIVGQTGDLVASLFKRDAGLKDSGTLLPGFGGVVDLLDSPLLVAPLAYWWLAAFQHP